MEITEKQRENFLRLKDELIGLGLVGFEGCINDILSEKPIPCMGYLVNGNFTKRKDLISFLLEKFEHISGYGMNIDVHPDLFDDVFPDYSCSSCPLTCLLQEEKDDLNAERNRLLIRKFGDCPNCREKTDCPKCLWQTKKIEIYFDKTIIGREISPIFVNRVAEFRRIKFIDCDISRIDFRDSKFIDCVFENCRE